MNDLCICASEDAQMHTKSGVDPGSSLSCTSKDAQMHKCTLIDFDGTPSQSTQSRDSAGRLFASAPRVHFISNPIRKVEFLLPPVGVAQVLRNRRIPLCKEQDISQSECRI